MTIKVHPSATISPLADIEDSIRGSVIEVGASSRIDSFVKIKPAGGSGNLIIGQATTINSGCVLYTGNGIRIGSSVAIAANCTFAPVNHAYQAKNKLITEQGFLPSKGGIVLEDDVWIGANVVLLDGAYIERGAVIGAMSVVKGRIPAYEVWAGNPIQKKGERQ